jgi:carbonic anhydrase
MRRNLILALAVVFPLALLGQEAAAPERLTPDTLWNALQKGNKNFVAGKIHFDELKAERLTLKDHQAPPVTVLSCSDSRVPLELIFDQSIGAMFGIRSAGNTADEFGIASIEYAILNGYTKLIVVLGHENCGAVKAALGGVDPNTPALMALVDRIRSSFVGIAFDARDAANVRKAIDANTRAAAAQMIAKSAVIRRAVQTEQVKIITAYYDFGTGEVKAVP